MVKKQPFQCGQFAIIQHFGIHYYYVLYYMVVLLLSLLESVLFYIFRLCVVNVTVKHFCLFIYYPLYFRCQCTGYALTTWFSFFFGLIHAILLFLQPPLFFPPIHLFFSFFYFVYSILLPDTACGLCTMQCSQILMLNRISSTWCFVHSKLFLIDYIHCINNFEFCLKTMFNIFGNYHKFYL